MRALVVSDVGRPAALERIPEPVITSPDQVLVRVDAAPLSRFDRMVVNGMLAELMDHVFPVTLGREFAGVVERVGDEVTGYAPGDHVIGMVGGTQLHSGAIAERVVVTVGQHLAHRPRGLDAEAAATLPMSAQVALAAVDHVAPASGQRVLVVGASGGLGLYAVQLVAARGAQVVATGRPADAALLHSFGARSVVDYRHGFLERLRADHGDGFDGIIDLASTPRELSALTEFVGADARVASSTLSADVVGLARRGVLAVNVMADLTPEDSLQRVVDLVESGVLRTVPVVGHDLDDAVGAVEALESGRVLGRHVVRCGTTSRTDLRSPRTSVPV